MYKHKYIDISISEKNTKMGKIPSFSVTAIKTCPENAPCFKECYAVKTARTYTNTRKAWERNYNAVMLHPFDVMQEIIYYIQGRPRAKKHPFFRWNVGGDVFDFRYMHIIDGVARACKNTNFWLPTKQYYVIKAFYSLVKNDIPSNLHIDFSEWNEYGRDVNMAGIGKAVFIPKGKSDQRFYNCTCTAQCDKCLHCFKNHDGVAFKQH